jgi:predicted AAA+ superfamily ATPase
METLMLDVLFPLSQQLLEVLYRPYVRYFIKKHSFEHRITIIRGQRGVGKSTVVVQLLRQQNLPDHQILYVPVDHFLVKNFSLYEIAQAFSLQGGLYLGFDEIHQYANWSQELKSIYDTFPKLHVFASGSSALAIHQGTYDLSRRAIVYTMQGMSFREYLELCHGLKFSPIEFEVVLSEHEKFSRQIVQTLNKASLNVLPLFSEYLHYGYYPYSIEFQDKTVFYLTVEQNLHTVIESDLPAIHLTLSGASVAKMKRLLGFLSTHVPFTVDLKELKNILDIADERTLKQYMKILEEAGIISSLHKNDKKMSGLKKADKIYPDNTCQLYALSVDQSVDKGTLREVFFLSMLKAHHEIHLPQIGDFLIDKKYTIEVGGKNKDFNQIKNLSNAYLALDDIEQGYQQKIPLWVFGFLY